MSYLTSDGIIAAIKTYIQNAPYDYAVMIDGEWGCGKSFLIRNELIKFIEEMHYNAEKNYKAVYISLHGISDSATLSRQFVTSIVTTSKVGKFANKAVPIIGATLRLAADVLQHPFSTTVNEKSTMNALIQHFYDLKQYIFVFDDIERCTIPIVEVLGFISNLVEINGVKVILVADEKKIKDSFEEGGLYHKVIGLASVSEKINFFGDKTPSSSYNKLNPHSQGAVDNGKGQLSLEDFVTLVTKHFPLDDNYRRIKEKVVGQTLYFKPDLEQVVPALIQSVFCHVNYKFSSDIFTTNDLAKIIIRAMNVEKHCNLRSVQMLLSYAAKLLPVVLPLIESRFDKEYLNALSQIIFNAAIIAIRFCKGKSYNESDYVNPLYGRSEDEEKLSYLSFPFVKDYFYSGIFSEEDTRDSLDLIISYIWKNKRDHDNPLELLKNFWFMHEDDVKDCLDKLFTDFEAGRYNLNDYQIIISNLLDLNTIGLININQIEKIVDKMCINARGNKLPSYFLKSFFGPKYSENIETYRNMLSKINESAKHGVEHSIKELILTTLSQGNLTSQEISEYYSRGDYLGHDANSYFIFSDLGMWLSALKKSDAKEIWDFRGLLSTIYRDYNSELYPQSQHIIE